MRRMLPWLLLCLLVASPAWALVQYLGGSGVGVIGSPAGCGVNGKIPKENNGVWACADDTGASTGAPVDATYLTQIPNGTLTTEQALSGLATGIILNTTTTGVVSIYVGASCTNQFPRSTNASGAWTCASVATTDLGFDPATQAELDAHVNDTTAAHAASAIGNTPAGTLAATDVQAALNELDTDARMSDKRAVHTHATDCTGGAVSARIGELCVDLDDLRQWICNSATCTTSNWLEASTASVRLASQTLAAGDQISVPASKAAVWVKPITAAGPITLTNAAQFTTTLAGQVIIVEGSSDAASVTMVDGNGVNLSQVSGTLVFTSRMRAAFVSDGTTVKEMHRSVVGGNETLQQTLVLGRTASVLDRAALAMSLGDGQAQAKSYTDATDGVTHECAKGSSACVKWSSLSWLGASAFAPDGTQCAAVTTGQINGVQHQWSECADTAGAELRSFQIRMPKEYEPERSGYKALKVQVLWFHDTATSGTMAYDVYARCQGLLEAAADTWSTAVAVDATFSLADAMTHSAEVTVTPAGTCHSRKGPVFLWLEFRRRATSQAAGRFVGASYAFRKAWE